MTKNSRLAPGVVGGKESKSKEKAIATRLFFAHINLKTASQSLAAQGKHPPHNGFSHSSWSIAQGLPTTPEAGDVKSPAEMGAAISDSTAAAQSGPMCAGRSMASVVHFRGKQKNKGWTELLLWRCHGPERAR